MAAVVGDVATELDAERLRAAGLRAEQIVTQGACHLDAGGGPTTPKLLDGARTHSLNHLPRRRDRPGRAGISQETP
jgi:hypothetical protein